MIGQKPALIFAIWTCLAGAVPVSGQTEARARLDQAVDLAHRGQFSQAAAKLVDAIALDPKLTEAHYLLGLVRQSWGKLDEAQASYEMALRLQPDYPEARLGLAAVLSRKALDLKGKPEPAIAACRKAIATNPGEAEPHFFLAKLEAQAGDHQVAVREYEAALKLQPDYPGAPLGLADSLLELQLFSRAVSLLRVLAQQQPREARVRQQLGLALSKTGQTAAAVEELGQAAQLDPDNPQVRYVLAMSLRKLGKTEESVEQMRVYQQLTAGRDRIMQARYHAGLAQKFAAGGETDQAIAEFERSLSYRPDPVVATNLGIALLLRDRVEEAITVLRRAADSAPEYALARYHLGLAYARKDRFAPAREAFAAALRIQPEFPEALFHLGVTCARQGRLNEAEKHLRESVRLRPDQAPPHYYLGMVLRDLGRSGEAEPEFRLAQRLDPGFAPR